jgi:hypothetical protein
VKSEIIMPTRPRRQQFAAAAAAAAAGLCLLVVVTMSSLSGNTPTTTLEGEPVFSQNGWVVSEVLPSLEKPVTANGAQSAPKNGAQSEEGDNGAPEDSFTRVATPYVKAIEEINSFAKAVAYMNKQLQHSDCQGLPALVASSTRQHAIFARDQNAAYEQLDQDAVEQIGRYGFFVFVKYAMT